MELDRAAELGGVPPGAFEHMRVWFGGHEVSYSIRVAAEVGAGSGSYLENAAAEAGYGVIAELLEAARLHPGHAVPVSGEPFVAFLSGHLCAYRQSSVIAPLALTGAAPA